MAGEILEPKGQPTFASFLINVTPMYITNTYLWIHSKL